MSLHPEAASMLEALNSGFPDVTTVPPPELRDVIRSRRAPLQHLPAMREVHDLTIDGPGGALALRIYRPESTEPELPVVVFAHGGGFVFCDLDSHDEFCRSMAEGVGVVVVSVDYRLAPEHRAPAAHEDMYAALEWAADNATTYGGDRSRIVLAGDSAGGNLAATVAIAARDNGGPAVFGQALFYPVIDDDFDTESYRKFGSGYYNTTKAMKWYWEQYAPDGTDDARVVPTRTGSLAGLPAAVVITAELDPPCSSGDDYAERLAAAGVRVRHRRFDGLFHGFLTFPSLSLTESARQEIWKMMRGLFD
ncbi:alpha/beta hydrolase [Rhodococcus chondri]|uniref:Alpha/beta hydrolase n=1 Tax=Rhodococcus chondri TaxID=3065941 RepID=A0ABU7JM37_9NOCA|nr:alpha/beta hydrolase [Rhodococcus sp. CC-R104]MEE2031099.1 alpha/beta hydrolase [Rhodococcus sp. CC-R104]